MGVKIYWLYHLQGDKNPGKQVSKVLHRTVFTGEAPVHLGSTLFLELLLDPLWVVVHIKLHFLPELITKSFIFTYQFDFILIETKSLLYVLFVSFEWSTRVI